MPRSCARRPPRPGCADDLSLPFEREEINEFSYEGGFVGLTYALPVERLNGSFALQGSIAQLR